MRVCPVRVVEGTVPRSEAFDAVCIQCGEKVGRVVEKLIKDARGVYENEPASPLPARCPKCGESGFVRVQQ